MDGRQSEDGGKRPAPHAGSAGDAARDGRTVPAGRVARAGGAAPTGSHAALPTIRPARQGDLDTLVAFNAAMALATEGRALDEARLRRGVERALADPGRGRYRVAERGGAVVGALLLTREWSDWRDGWFWWIQSVYVAPEARGSGVYRALHASVLDEARRDGDVCGIRLYVEQDNRVAQATYAAVGMARTHYVFFEDDFTAPKGS